MSDPHEVFGLSTDASETEIRQRYLQLVREFPPDQAPDRFAAIHAAYEALRDPTARLKAQLFGMKPGSDSFEAITADLSARLRDVRLPLDTLLSLSDSP